MSEITGERWNIDFFNHWFRIILIILLVGLLDGIISTRIFPSRDEFKEAYEISELYINEQNMTPLDTAIYLQVVVAFKHFGWDAILLFPAVILRFFIVRRPLFRIHGFVSALISIIAVCLIVLFSRGFEAMGKNLSVFLVLFGFYSLLFTRRKV